jgi:hypothetical protein
MLVNFGRAEFTGEAAAGTQRNASPPDLDCVSTVCHAPEFLLGWNHDAAVDCWSFGMLLYYMVFGMVLYANIPSSLASLMPLFFFSSFSTLLVVGKAPRTIMLGFMTGLSARKFQRSLCASFILWRVV